MPVTHGGVVMLVGGEGRGGKGGEGAAQCTGSPGSHRLPSDRSKWAAA